MSNHNILQSTPRELVGKAVKAIDYVLLHTTDSGARAALDQVRQVVEVLGYADKLNEQEIRRLNALIQLHITYEDEIIAVEVDKQVEARKRELEEQIVTKFVAMGR